MVSLCIADKAAYSAGMRLHTSASFFYLLMATAATAAEPIVTYGVGGNDQTQSARFFSIEGARSGRPSVVRPKAGKSRSDSTAIADGFLRIDRNHTVAMRSPLIVYPAPPIPSQMIDTPRILSTPDTTQSASLKEATIIPRMNQNDPVLSLFDAQTSAPPRSFRDALSEAGQPSPALMKHQWPVAREASRVSSDYGFRNDPFHQQTQFHSGIDIPAMTGTPVLASANGVVSFVGEQSGYGRTITLKHPDGSESNYGHLSATYVADGQTVKAGQKIGAVGSSGRSTGAHLDYSVRKDGVTVDPGMALGTNPTPSSMQRDQKKTRTATSQRTISVQ